MRILLVFAGLLLSGFLQAQDIDSAWFRNNYTKQETYITMRDGVRLFTSIYTPKSTSEAHPILMTRTPYSCAPYGAEYRGLWATYEKAYLKEGYIMVIQDVRGRWMSEGDFENVRPFNPAKKDKDIDEASDTYDAIDWLVKNLPNNNGKVGVFGISYPGFYSTMAAASGHPNLVAVSPQAPVTNWFIGDDFHHKGAFMQMDAFSFYTRLGGGFGVPHPRPVATAPAPVPYPTYDNYEFYLRAGTLANLSKYTGDSIAFWKDLMAHPNYDTFWRARDARNATHDLKPAMLWVGGLFDAEDCWGAWNAYKAAEENNPDKAFNKIIMGPWYHGQWANNDGTHHGNVAFGQNTSIFYQQVFEVPFFNYYLKGKGDLSSMAEANIFFTGENKWRAFDRWPPAGIRQQEFYFQPGGKLVAEKAPTATNSYTEYISDPAKPVPYEQDVHFNRTRNYMSNDQRFAARRTDVLVFQTEPLTADLTLAGPVQANLETSISTTDADFVVKLIDVYPDEATHSEVDIYAEEDQPNKVQLGGYQQLVRGEVFRGRFRKSFETPVAFTPNKIESVSFELPDVAHQFKKGHRIMIQVQSSWFPLVDRNPQQFVDIYHAAEKDFIKSVIKVYHDKAHASSVTLPVIQ